MRSTAKPSSGSRAAESPFTSPAPASCTANGYAAKTGSSTLASNSAVKELKDANDNAPYINLHYPGAGHAFLGQLPYFPNSGYGAHGSFGGTQQANALATEQCWAKMINFLDHPWARVKA